MNFLLSSGRINLDDVQNDIENMKKKKVLDSHPFSVWEGTDGKWRTYLPDEGKGRLLKKRNTRQQIEKVILDYYDEIEKQKKPINFKFAYDRWLEKYSIRFTSDNTLIKYKSDYQRFFSNRSFESMPIYDHNEESVETFIIGIIKELELSPKACKTLCGYIRNTFKSAKVNKLIGENPFENIETKTFYPHCKRIIKTAKERTVSGKEFGLLYQRFEADYRKKPNYIPTYAVQFASLTGFRVSEISALMWTDIQNGSIKVDKSEKYNRATKEYWIGKTKNEKIRYMPLTDEIIALLYRLRTIQIEYDYLGDYIFQNEEGRIHAPTISACAKNKCIQLGIPVKSIHSYRRTFSSRLKCSGVSSTVVSALLGHTEEVNEQYYTYDVTDIEEKKLMVGMITKEIASSQFVAPNCGIEGQYVLSNGKGNQR